MMIQGKQGQLCLYYNELLIAGYPLGKMNITDYRKIADDLIINSMRTEKRNMREQIFAYKYFCQCIYSRKLKKKYISIDDYRMFLACLLALVKLRIYESDDVSMVFPRKK
jgi:hypothetical protein